jgi:hypothetical protein
MLFSLRLAAFATISFAVAGHALAAPPGVTVLGARTQNSSAATAAAPAMRPVVVRTVVDADVAGREPFQAQISLSASSPSAIVTVPEGKRLIIEEINVAGAATSTSGPIQPIVLAYTTVAGFPQQDFYYGISQSTTVGGQYYSDFPVKLYADSLEFGLGFSGFSPTYLGMYVTISGHLIAETAP